MQFAALPTVELPEDVLKNIQLGPKRSYIRREPAVPFDDFYDTIVLPTMQHVAAKNIKKNMAMTISALCGCIDFLPIHPDYTGTTNPFQTFSSSLTRKMLQPAYSGKNPTKAQSVKPATIALDQTTIPVHPQLTLERGVPKAIIDRFVQLCNKYHIDHRIFTQTGGSITLTKNFLMVVSYWASDQGLEADKKIWGSLKPMRYVPTRWLDDKDLPEYIKKKVNGRKPGRPARIKT